MNFVFVFLRICHTIFQSGWIILHSHQQYTSILISPYPCQHFFFFGLFCWGLRERRMTILIGVKCSIVIVSLICIFLMINDIEHFLCVYWQFVYSLEKCLLNSYTILKIVLLLLLWLSKKYFKIASDCVTLLIKILAWLPTEVE